MLFGKLDRYIFWQCLAGILIAISVISLAIIMVDLVEQLRSVSGVKGAGFTTALYLTLLRLPSLIQQTTPITVLIASILTFTTLSRRSEIIAMRAAGVSAWRFIAPLAFLAAFLGVFLIVVVGPIAANLNQKCEDLKTQLVTNITTESSHNEGDWTTIPTRNGQVIISGKAETNNTPDSKLFTNAYLLEFENKDSKFIRRLDAQKIIINKDEIRLENVIQSTTGAQSVTANLMQIPLGKYHMDTTNIDIKTIPLWDLPISAKKAKISGGNPDKFWLQFYKLLALPITMTSIAMFSALMSIGMDRGGGKLKAISIAIFLGFLMYFINDLTGLLTTGAGIPPAISAFCPPIFSLAAVLAFFSYKEDGDAEFS